MSSLKREEVYSLMEDEYIEELQFTKGDEICILGYPIKEGNRNEGKLKEIKGKVEEVRFL